MAFLYFEDSDGNYTIINDRHLIFIDQRIDEKGCFSYIKMTNTCYATVRTEIHVADDIEIALEGIKLLKEGL